MTITLPDRSQYFRGLLLLISMDRVIALPERQLLSRIGRALDFEKAFCERAIDDILENRHITHDAPGFSSPELAGKFVRDGLRLALSDGHVHPSEVDWLKTVATHNGLDETWFERAMRDVADRSSAGDLEVNHLLIE